MVHVELMVVVGFQSLLIMQMQIHLIEVILRKMGQIVLR